MFFFNFFFFYNAICLNILLDQAIVVGAILTVTVYDRQVVLW